jgi:transposase
MVDSLSLRLVPDALWEIVQPLIPVVPPRPRGGGTAVTDDRAVFTAIVFVLTSGCAWRHLPPSFGVSVPPAHRRFTAWDRGRIVAPPASGRAGPARRGRGHRLVGGDPGRGQRPGEKGDRSLTGPNPVDRGKTGSKLKTGRWHYL